MLSRKEQNQSGIHLPTKWQDEVRELLHSIYVEQLSSNNKDFEVFGQTFPNELFVAVSLIDPNDELGIPVTYMISADLDEKIKAEKILNNVVDSVGLFFDLYFADKNWNDYETTWQSAESKGLKFFYNISRENVGLTLQANSLLESN
jgi:hypothetical protein